MSELTTPCDSPGARQFDFWLGRWDLTWPAEQAGGEAGETMTGTNWVDRLFGDCVIEENFSTSDEGFQGRSLSVFDPATEFWRQTWVDSSGAYLVFTGGFDGDRMILATDPAERDGVMVINRMVFSQITPQSLYWEWQRSVDDGATWTDLWTINYRRRTS